MKTYRLLFVNNKPAICGVYKYGHTLGSLLSQYENFHYTEATSIYEVENAVEQYKPDFLFYNYHCHTTQWLTQDFARKHPSLLTAHDIESNWPGITNIFLDPYYIENNNNYRIVRPIPKFQSSLNVIANSVGIWGFAFGHKYYHDMIELIDSQLDYGLIRLHIPYSTYSDINGKFAREHADVCRKVKKNNDVKLEITHEYKSDVDFLNWLSEHSVNCFLYKNVPLTQGRVGCSSSIDWAIAVRRPIAVNDNQMVRHLKHIEPSIMLENNTLPNIIKNGFEPIAKVTDEWTAENIWKDLQRIMNLVGK